MIIYINTVFHDFQSTDIHMMVFNSTPQIFFYILKVRKLNLGEDE